jgi:ribosomal protein S18 acetylase RimI-like enzyme
LLYLGINKEHRSQRRGRQALKQAFEFFSTRKVNRISTQVDVHNDPAIRCYAAVGFHELSRSKLYVFQNR